jgi:hypothetical protein
MSISVLTATYELRVSRKSHLRDHPKGNERRRRRGGGGGEREGEGEEEEKEIRGEGECTAGHH